jgi:hypothetical protein
MKPPSRAEVERALKATALGLGLGAVLALVRRCAEDRAPSCGRMRTDRSHRG